MCVELKVERKNLRTAVPSGSVSRKGRLQVSVFLNRVPLRYYCSNEAVGAIRRTSERARRGRCRRAGRRFYRHREFPPRFIIRGTFAHVFSVQFCIIYHYQVTESALHVNRSPAAPPSVVEPRFQHFRRAAAAAQLRLGGESASVPLQALGPVHPAGCSRPRPRNEGHG
jgi:hypothetical protein